MVEQKLEIKKEATKSSSANTREYTIPLRRAWIKKANYRRTGIAVKAIKQFIARHMKVPDRDVSKVKLDPHFNNEVWFRGRAKPPAKVSVRAEKDGELVRVTFAETPQHVAFAKKRHERRHQPATKSKAPTTPTETKTDEATPKEKTDEKEKSQSAATQKETQAKAQAKATKHVTQVKEPKIQRKALKK